MSIKLLIDGILADRREVKAAGEFSLVADLTTRQGRSCRVEVLTREYFVPRFFNGAADDRKLSAVLVEQRIEQG